ncbi:MAG TPA: hypothetical protein VNT23_06970, partial [Gaiellaceae bacterium]|nr:hypothetical protein [Gaiellaceae bacterium]
VGFSTRIVADCGDPVETATLETRLLLDLSREYVHLYEIPTARGTVRGSLTADHPSVTIDFEGPAPTPSVTEEPDRQAQLEGLVRGHGGTSLVLGLGLAVILGILHGLTPGHGKTLTAAYLAGMHGTFRDASLLAAVVAIAHGISTLGLAVLASGIDKLAPARLEPWLEGATALIAAAVGIALLRGASLHRHRHDHGHEAPAAGRRPIGQLVAIGIIGGLIPGPEAFAVGFLAVALDRVVLGLVLIGAFSLGLALVVFGIAALAVAAGRHLSAAPTIEKHAQRAGGVVFLLVAAFLAQRALS